MTSTRERYEAQAAAWDAAGRPDTVLLDGYDLIALRCWQWSEGAKREGVTERLSDFIRAAEARQRPNWLDAYFDERENCRGCGESYRFENVSLCSACSRCYCYRCVGALGRADNGNPACPCGRGELVG